MLQEQNQGGKRQARVWGERHRDACPDTEDGDALASGLPLPTLAPIPEHLQTITACTSHLALFFLFVCLLFNYTILNNWKENLSFTLCFHISCTKLGSPYFILLAALWQCNSPRALFPSDTQIIYPATAWQVKQKHFFAKGLAANFTRELGLALSNRNKEHYCLLLQEERRAARRGGSWGDAAVPF